MKTFCKLRRAALVIDMLARWLSTEKCDTSIPFGKTRVRLISDQLIIGQDLTEQRHRQRISCGRQFIQGPPNSASMCQRRDALTCLCHFGGVQINDFDTGRSHQHPPKPGPKGLLLRNGHRSVTALRHLRQMHARLCRCQDVAAVFDGASAQQGRPNGRHRSPGKRPKGTEIMPAPACANCPRKRCGNLKVGNRSSCREDEPGNLGQQYFLHPGGIRLIPGKSRSRIPARRTCGSCHTVHLMSAVRARSGRTD